MEMREAFGETKPIRNKPTNERRERREYITVSWIKRLEEGSCQGNSKNETNKNQECEQVWNTRLGICGRS